MKLRAVTDMSFCKLFLLARHPACYTYSCGRFCSSKERTVVPEASADGDRSDYMPKVNLDEIPGRKRQEMDELFRYQREFGDVQRKKRRSPGLSPNDPVARKKNGLLLSFLLLVVCGTYYYTVNQIARESYLDEKLDSDTSKWFFNLNLLEIFFAVSQYDSFDTAKLLL